MRTIILLRHAKSSWALPGTEDHDRDLNDRGKRASAVMAKWLDNTNVRPDHILCSSANRTRKTMGLMGETVDFLSSVHFTEELYLASANRILRLVSSFDDDAKTAMVIAHNPGLHEAALNFLAPDEKSGSGDLRISFPTCAIAIITLPIETWADTEWDKGHLNAYMVPRALME